MNNASANLRTHPNETKEHNDEHNNKNKNNNHDDDDYEASSKSYRQKLPTHLFFLFLLRNQQHWKGWVCKGLLVLLAIVVMIHRFCANYEAHKSYVHAPIHFIERECPAPSYPTLLQMQHHQQQQQLVQQQNQPLPQKEEEQQYRPKICLTTLTDEEEKSKLQRMIRWRNFDGLLDLTWENKLNYAQKHGYFLFNESSSLDRSRPPSWSKIKATQRLLTEEACDWVWWVDADTVLMNSHKIVEAFLPAPVVPPMTGTGTNNNNNNTDTETLEVSTTTTKTKTMTYQPDMLLSEHPTGGYNAGGWWIRNSEYALDFLEIWWNMKEYVKPPGLSKSGDNDALQALLASRKEKMGQEHFDTHFLVPPGCTFNAFAHFLSPKETKETDEELKKHYWYKDKSYAMYHKGDLLAHVAGFNNKEDSIQMLLDIAEWKQT